MTDPTPYDLYPYPRQAFHQTHPGHLGAIAHLMGVGAAPGDACRVLEIGCARGSNLVPLAYALPESQFVGIDLSPVQIDDAKNFAAGVGVKNLRLECADICQLDESLGEFDYIVAHGIYSWIPAHVRDALLAACARHLAPQGVAYISYNTHPGGHMRNMLRQLCLFETRDAEMPAQGPPRVRELFKRMKHALHDRSDAYAKAMLEQIQLTEPTEDGFLVHDILEAVNEPVYFYRFAEHAARFKLRYLAEAHLVTHFALGIEPEDLERIDPEGDRVQYEQYLDFLYGRSFRSTLLCHEDVAIYRQPMPTRLSGLSVTSSATRQANVAEPTGAVSFANDQCELDIQHPLGKAAVDCLQDAWPGAIRWETLVQAARTRSDRENLDAAEDEQTLAAMAFGWFALELIELSHTKPAPATPRTAAREVSAVARYQAARHWPVFDRGHRHRTAPRSALARVIWVGLDGSRERAELIDGVLAMLETSEVSWDGKDPLPSEPTARRGAVEQRVTEEMDLLHRSRLFVT